MKEIECPVFGFAVSDPQRIAVRDGLSDITYKELNNRINGTVLNLKLKGINPGDRIAIVSENNLEYIVLSFAILRTGGTVVPVNFRFPVPEIKRIVAEMGIGLMISTFASRSDKKFGVSHLKFDEIIPGVEEEFPEIKKVSLSKGETIFLTSGTTGIAKGVLHSVENHVFNALGSNENIRLNGDEKWLLILPLFHVGGFAIPFRVFLAGASVVLPEKRETGSVYLIHKHNISHVSMVATQLIEFTDYLEERNIESPETLKAVLTGGGVIPGSLLLRALDLNVPVYTTYGMTEMSSQVTTTKGVLEKEKTGSSGSVLNFREMKVGPDGNIFVRGKTLFSGYLTKEGVSSPHLTKDGWFDTGDMGEVDESGDLFVRGRKDNMFISGGENIFPEEIESELLKLDNIVEAVVFAVYDEKYGNRPVAFIKTEGNVLKKFDLIRKLKKTLPGFKVPERYYYLGSDNAGLMKRDRSYLKELYDRGSEKEEISD